MVNCILTNIYYKYNISVKLESTIVMARKHKSVKWPSNVIVIMKQHKVLHIPNHCRRYRCLIYNFIKFLFNQCGAVVAILW